MSAQPVMASPSAKRSYRNDPYKKTIPSGTPSETSSPAPAGGPMFSAVDEAPFLDEDQPLYLGSVDGGVDDEHLPPARCPPPGTLHAHLWGRVTFVEYPTEQFHTSAQKPDDRDMVRVFIGQLPYFVTDMQLSWLCATFGGGNVVAYPERIMKRQPNGDRLPTGCIHAYASVHAVEAMASGMHKRMLVDDTGVWHAQSAAEFDVLSSYVASMKADKRLRVPNRPYDSVVVQLATSTYVPVNPMPLTEFPNERLPKGRQPRAKTSPAPPAYRDSVVPPPPYRADAI